MIYVDNAATTRISKAAKDTIALLLDEYGNPSSSHSLGVSASDVLLSSRRKIKSLIGAGESDTLIFTSGGSEANNQALLAAAMTNKKRIIISAFEHDSVYNTAISLEREGFEIILAGIDSNGFVSVEEIEKSIDRNTALVSIMTANNEIGTLQPIREIGGICHKHGVLFHTDAVQALGHTNIDVNDMKVDMLSFSAHKFGGMKGTGALYVRNGVTVGQLIVGGNQEKQLRAGTENIIGIASMASALEASLSELEEKQKRLCALRDRLTDKLLTIPEAILNGARTDRLAGNVNVSFRGINSDAVLLMLDKAGICASSGAACHSAEGTPSRTLLAIGRDEETAKNSVRFSLSNENTPDEIDFIAETVKSIITKIR